MTAASRLLCGLLTAASFSISAPASSQTRDTPPPPPPPRGQAVPPVGITMGPMDPRDRRPMQQTGTASLKGRVVDGVTGRPLRRARVRLMGIVQKGPILTDDAGQFEFASLPQGSYGVNVDKSTYMPSRYPEVNRSLKNRLGTITIADGQAVEDVTVPMYHGGVITGRVFDAHGDPVDQAAISVLFLPRSGRPQQRGGGGTNDLGEYRAARLQPGRYIVRARAQGGGAPDPNPSAKSLPQSLPVYFPNALSPDQAQVLVVNRGETLSGIDIILGEGQPTVVSGIVMAADGQPFQGGNVSFRMASAGNEFGGADGGTGIRPDGTFRVQMPPGEYVFEAFAQPARTGSQPIRPEMQLFGSTRVNVSGDALEGVVITIGNGATASGRIVFEGTTPPPIVPPGPTRVPMFNPDGPGCRAGMATIAPDWTFRVEGLGGACAAQPTSVFGRWTLKAVTVGGQNLMDELVTFQPGQHYGNIRIVVTDKRTQVEVRVADESGQPTRDYVVLMFPADKERWTQLPRYVRTFGSQASQAGMMTMTTMMMMPSGSMTGSIPRPAPGSLQATIANRPPRADNVARMMNVAAGEYYAIALDDMDPEDSTDPAVLEKLIPAAVKVNVTMDAPAEIHLRRTPLADIIR
jgi:carboxypeptidase family protein